MIFPLWNIYSWKMLRKLKWQLPGEPLAVRYNQCQGPIPGRGPAVEKHCLTLYQSYLDNRYSRTAIYNDSENSNKVSNWAKVRHGVPQGSVLEPLLFLLYINDLTKIINKTSAPIIFADDTSILFAHSNLIDFWQKHSHSFYNFK